jgi:5,6-dimethylbenzimidazole synthase
MEPEELHSERAEPLPAMWRQGVYRTIAARRDVREFLPDPIPKDILARILMAAHQAGSVGFMQPWNFVVVEDREIRRQIRAHVEAQRLLAAADFEGERREKYLAFKLEGIVDAPLNVCVTCDPTRFGPAVIGRHTIRETDAYSTCGAVQNLWLAARAEGIGVGWVSILEPARLRALLDIPEHIIPVAYLCLGYVREFPRRPTFETAGWLPRVPLEQLVYSGKFGRPAEPELAAALHSEMQHDSPDAQLAAVRGNTKIHGLVVLYTGNGKGKTTAALGLMLRALGRELPMAVVQFIKGKWKTGERLFAEGLPQVEFLVMGRGFTWESEDLDRDKQAAAAAWEKARAMILSGKYFAVILDEITYAIHYGFIELADVLQTVRDRPANVHVVITGRNAPQELIDCADLVTEMRSVKHPFDKGLTAQVGIDF